MRTKQDIIEAIRQTAKENGGKPLGIGRFEKETGIKRHEWGKYWARFSDLQKEADIAPNQLQAAYGHEFLMEKLASLTRKLRKFPTYPEIIVEKNNDPEFPNKGTFLRLGKKEQLAAKVMEYCKDRSGYDDIFKLCESALAESSKERMVDDYSPDQELGEVYLFKSGRYYKIGKTNDTVRRGSELRIQLPERMVICAPEAGDLGQES